METLSTQTKDVIVWAVSGIVASVLTTAVVVTLYLVVFALTRTAGVNDCVITYAKQLNANTYTGAFVYDVGDNLTHVDVDTLPLPVIGTVDGCVNSIPGRPLDSVANTAYCNVARALF